MQNYHQSFFLRARDEILLIILYLLSLPLIFLYPDKVSTVHTLVDWKTMGALVGLMVLSKGLEVSGYLDSLGKLLVKKAKTQRGVAVILTLFSAVLSVVITNDVALFIVIPLVLGLKKVSDVSAGRMVIFQALAVNAGSCISPIGNPQNLFLWQVSGSSIPQFLWAMAPVGFVLMMVVLVAIPIAFSSEKITFLNQDSGQQFDTRLFRVSLLLYLPFLILADFGFALFPLAESYWLTVFFSRESWVKSIGFCC